MWTYANVSGVPSTCKYPTICSYFASASVRLERGSEQRHLHQPSIALRPSSSIEGPSPHGFLAEVSTFHCFSNTAGPNLPNNPSAHSKTIIKIPRGHKHMKKCLTYEKKMFNLTRNQRNPNQNNKMQSLPIMLVTLFNDSTPRWWEQGKEAISCAAGRSMNTGTIFLEGNLAMCYQEPENRPYPSIP